MNMDLLSCRWFVVSRYGLLKVCGGSGKYVTRYAEQVRSWHH